eukprot:2863545-Karenia_brevis.AAC.1
MLCLLFGKKRGRLVARVEQLNAQHSDRWQEALQAKSPSLQYLHLIDIMNQALLEIFPVKTPVADPVHEQLLAERVQLLN